MTTAVDAISVLFAARGEISDAEINGLHALAFDDVATSRPWTERLETHSLTWITGRLDGELVAFVNILGDGGEHAILMDTMVAPHLQGSGAGTRLVEAAATEARVLGCRWLHADYEPHLTPFYEGSCGMRSTRAGLLSL